MLLVHFPMNWKHLYFHPRDWPELEQEPEVEPELELELGLPMD